MELQSEKRCWKSAMYVYLLTSSFTISAPKDPNPYPKVEDRPNVPNVALSNDVIHALNSDYDCVVLNLHTGRPLEDLP